VTLYRRTKQEHVNTRGEVYEHLEQTFAPDPEATADAELGALVRKLPECWTLFREEIPDEWQVWDTDELVRATGLTPEAALRAALGGQ